LLLGRFRHVRATFKVNAEQYRREIGFDYAVLLTGQDYPLRTNPIIPELLGPSKGQSLVRHLLDVIDAQLLSK
jgi:hypothetical protein